MESREHGDLSDGDSGSAGDGIIVEQLGCDPGGRGAEASFIDDLGADSLDIVELVMAMEEAFDVEISRRGRREASRPSATS